MSYFFVNKPLVNLDLINIVEFYKNINLSLAISFLDRLEEAKEYIFDNPYYFQVKYKNVRTVLLKQFPYHFHYIIDEDKKQIIVLAIIHTFQNPKDYSNR